MSSAGELAVCEARKWLGTPYVHQASVKGAGCDCLGLVRGVWRALYGAEPEAVPAYTADWSEASHDERLWRAALRHLTSVEHRAPAIGDVVLFRMRGGSVAKHVGILSGLCKGPCFLHSYNRHGVIESPLSEPWRRRIVGRFEFPEGKI